MKEMKCDFDREKHCSITYEGGGLKYEFIADYAKNLPPYLADYTWASCAGGFVDNEDNLIMCYRGTPNPFIKLDPEGNYVGQFGAGTIKACHFGCITPENTVLMTDIPVHVVREIDPATGKVIRDLGNYGKGSDSGFDGLYYNKQRRLGNLYPPEPYMRMPMLTALTEAERATIKRCAEPFNRPTDVALNSKGEIFVSDGYGNCAVHRFSRDGKLLKTWGGVGDEPGKFLMVHAVTVDAKDQVWVLDRDNNAIHVFDAEGNVLAYCKGNLGQPSGIDTDGEYIYVVGRGGYLTVFTPEFEVVAQIGYFNSELRAHDLAVDSKGNIFLFPTTATEDHQCICLKRIR